MRSLTTKEIFSDANLPLNLVLLRLKKLLSPPNQLLQELRTLPRYHDEPRFYQFVAKPVAYESVLDQSLVGVGTSLNKSRAQVKALAEAVERCCLARTAVSPVVRPAINLRGVIELEGLPEFYRDSRRLHQVVQLPMTWLGGYSLDKQILRPAFVPAQLITVPYALKKTEPIIRHPISTGAALGTSYAASILAGLMEVIERDAFMLSYYQEKVNHEVLTTGVHRLEPYIKELTRCRLTLRLFDISVDTGGYIFLALLLDDTGYGPHLTAGMKAGFDAAAVAQGSIEEAVQLRTWLRDLMLLTPPDSSKVSPYEIVSLRDRAVFWFDRSLRTKLDFYFKCPRTVKLSDYPKPPPLNPVHLLQVQLTRLCDLGVNLYFVDLTDPVLLKAGFRVTKTIATKLQPMHLDERAGFPIGPRFSVTHLKATPHFFL